MDGWPLLLEIIAVLTGCFLFGALFERIRLGAIVGYIVGGVLVGPFAFGLVKSVDVVQGLAELGIALLLFSTGLEFSPLRLRKLGKSVLKAGVSQLVVTIAAFALIAKGFGLSWSESAAIGFIASVSSTAIVLRKLRERGDLDAAHGKISIGILLIQDVALIPLVLGITILARPFGTVSDAATPALLPLLGMGIIATIVVTRVIPRAFRSRAMATNRELPILLAVVTCAGAAYAAHSVGASPSLGAFIAGVMLAETSFEYQIRSDIAPLRALFGTVFFASVGMLADVRWIANHLGAVASVALLLIFVKTLANFIAIRPWRTTTTISLAAAICLGQIGELGFILLQTASKGGLVSNTVSQLLTSVAVVSMLIAPFSVMKAPRIARKLARWLVPGRTLAKEELTSQADGYSNHIVVFGFGTAGRTASRVLSEARYKVVIVDVDPRIVKAAEELGVVAKVGDATQPELLDDLHLNDAQAMIVAIPDHRTAGLVVRHARHLAPHLPIVVRSRNHPYAEDLRDAGSNLVIGEEELLGRRLGEEAVRLAIGSEDDEVRDAP